MRPILREAARLTGAALERARAALAPWIHQASNPFADWYFGDPEVAREMIIEWMARPSSELHHGRALLLTSEDEDVLLGGLVGLGGVELAECRAADFVAFCGELGEGPEAEAVIEEVLPVARILFPPVAHDAFYISRVAIDPARRGEGLGRALVERSLEHAAARGFRRFRLDVSSDNEAALATYRRLGFRVVGTAESAAHGLRYQAMEMVLR